MYPPAAVRPTGKLAPVMNFWLTSVPSSRARPIVPAPLRNGARLVQYRYPPAATAPAGAGDAPAGEPPPTSNAVATATASRPARNRVLRCCQASSPLPVILVPPSQCAIYVTYAIVPCLVLQP